jgi:biopolymer transport protein ExbB
MEQMTLFDLFQKGEWAMWPLLVFSIITVSVIIERFIYILTHKLSIRKVARNTLEEINNNNIDGAREYCKKCKKRILGAHVILSALNMARLGEHRMEKAIEAEASEKINEMERGLNILVALGSLAPITGFLGTVSGMINAFQSIAAAADVNAQLVANGIFEALITTAYGLLIAIVAIAAYNFFSFLVDKFTADIEQLGSDIITAVLVSGGNQS